MDASQPTSGSPSVKRRPLGPEIPHPAVTSGEVVVNTAVGRAVPASRFCRGIVTDTVRL